ncbi:tyrosinase [Streptomyces sp. 2231.1]|uniref:tyrosinase MelC2 n=1 Tax=Streptomyces sp. 2231.1 TaxID=1855347 RepID=UPI0008979238|nr:tyrosinase family protein [Streptomyces sp. 2231.1]SEE72570.1 tyrosinase [Streptomyces sp. 2231.1]
MTVRKNQASLTAAEKRAFTSAILELKRTGIYDRFVITHNNFITNDTDTGERVGHRSPSFLPWHRKFLMEFESALQSVDSSVSIPYWDWTAERELTSSLWATDFLGGTGRAEDQQVMDGPFAASNGAWPIGDGVDERKFLRRSLGSGLPLPEREEVDAALAVDVYDVAPWNSASRGGFRNTIEGWRGFRGTGIHNRVHTWVGGNMATGASPNDPAFWLHHAFIDKLWAQWQQLHPDSEYLPRSATPDVVSLHDTMRPWHNESPADMLNHTDFYTYDSA